MPSYNQLINADLELVTPAMQVNSFVFSKCCPYPPTEHQEVSNRIEKGGGMTPPESSESALFT